MMTGRHFIGIEKNEEYYAIAEKRIYITLLNIKVYEVIICQKVSFMGSSLLNIEVIF